MILSALNLLAEQDVVAAASTCLDSVVERFFSVLEARAFGGSHWKHLGSVDCLLCLKTKDLLATVSIRSCLKA